LSEVFTTLMNLNRKGEEEPSEWERTWCFIYTCSRKKPKATFFQFCSEAKNKRKDIFVVVVPGCFKIIYTINYR
jgi:hypothetical protein